MDTTDDKTAVKKLLGTLEVNSQENAVHIEVSKRQADIKRLRECLTEAVKIVDQIKSYRRAS